MIADRPAPDRFRLSFDREVFHIQLSEAEIWSACINQTDDDQCLDYNPSLAAHADGPRIAPSPQRSVMNKIGFEPRRSPEPRDLANPSPAHTPHRRCETRAADSPSEQPALETITRLQSMIRTSRPRADFLAKRRAAAVIQAAWRKRMHSHRSSVAPDHPFDATVDPTISPPNDHHEPNKAHTHNAQAMQPDMAAVSIFDADGNDSEPGSGPEAPLPPCPDLFLKRAQSDPSEAVVDLTEEQLPADSEASVDEKAKLLAELEALREKRRMLLSMKHTQATPSLDDGISAVSAESATDTSAAIPKAPLLASDDCLSPPMLSFSEASRPATAGHPETIASEPATMIPAPLSSMPVSTMATPNQSRLLPNQYPPMPDPDDILSLPPKALQMLTTMNTEINGRRMCEHVLVITPMVGAPPPSPTSTMIERIQERRRHGTPWTPKPIKDDLSDSEGSQLAATESPAKPESLKRAFVETAMAGDPEAETAGLDHGARKTKRIRWNPDFSICYFNEKEATQSVTLDMLDGDSSHTHVSADSKSLIGGVPPSRGTATSHRRKSALRLAEHDLKSPWTSEAFAETVVEYSRYVYVAPTTASNPAAGRSSKKSRPPAVAVSRAPAKGKVGSGMKGTTGKPANEGGGALAGGARRSAAKKM
ncbi:uncharacterized protein BJ171DRAFT_486007 [Polychytrium aggregatum]|uniref:uncharacterized protein n=1 Tax=Polychytrium aggregatum TaxID=110093 RepID=UPI0022FEC1C8|nr:uncharacterized protein BJ171DRAFT_486007 [Polychytrium aggregatum]KAI9209275.1 hypothetical protein BJ171DRAFT_486007 [Polychytrium aggregatum]